MSRLQKIALIFLLCVASSRAELYYPTDDASWQTTTAAGAGADPVLLADAVNYAQQANSTSLVILHGGRILSEHYWGGWTRGTTGKLYSATKSMVSAITGQLVSLGQFTSLDQRSSEFLPEWQGVPGKQDITLRHHLEMTTGLEGGEQNLVRGALAKSERFFAVNLPLQYTPGTYWTYNNPAYRLLFYIIEGATGDNFPNVFAQYLANPIGMSSANVVVRTAQVGNTTVTNYQYVEATALATARFGLLALRRGLWKTTQVVPAAFLDQATVSSQQINPSYGFLWWLNSGATSGGHQQLFDGVLRSGPMYPEAPPDLYTALGKDDQIIAVVPSLDLVIVRQGVNPLGVGGEAISPEQNILFGKIARAFGYAGQAQLLSLNIAPSAGGIQLNWTSWYGRNYQPQQSVNLGQTPWSDIGTPISGTGLNLTIERPIGVPQNFFRVQIVE